MPTYSFNELFDAIPFEGNTAISVPIGTDNKSDLFFKDLSKIPHMLICGISGSGKTTFLQTLLTLAAKRYSPAMLKYVIYSSKLDYSIFDGEMHMLVPVIDDLRKCFGAVEWCVVEMLKRFRAFSERKVADLTAYNSVVDEVLPEIFLVIDDLYEVLIFGSTDLVECLIRLLLNGRKAGIHCILVTSYVSEKILRQKLLPNIPCKVCFTLSSDAESKAMIGMKNAHNLQCPGEIIYKDVSSLKQLTAVCASYEELKIELEPLMKKAVSIGVGSVNYSSTKKMPLHVDEDENGPMVDYDEMLPYGVDVVLEMGSCSVSMLQRRLKLGYSRAARIIDQMEELRVVGPYEGAKPRSVLVNRREWEKIAKESGFALTEPRKDIDNNSDY